MSKIPDKPSRCCILDTILDDVVLMMMRTYRKVIYLLLVISCLLTAGCNQPALPKAVLHDSNGNVVRLADYLGKWVFINYWASWCEPCTKEIPVLNAFYKSQPSSKVIVLGVSYDHATPQQLPQFIKHVGAQFPTLTTDPATQLGFNEIAGLPTTFVIGPNGRLQKTLQGPQSQTSLLAAMK